MGTSEENQRFPALREWEQTGNSREQTGKETHMEITINETSDLLTVAAILVKNGYTVRMGKRKKDSTKTAYEKILIVTKEG